MTGSGFANAFSDLENSEGSSRFDVVFEVVDPVNVTLEGSFEMQDIAFGSLLAIAQVEVFGGAPVLGQTYFPFDEIQPFLFEGLLGPGLYRLLVSLSPNGNTDTFFDFSFAVTPVPEPGTGALLGLGLALVGWQRRRHGRVEPTAPAG
jgi:hypothetical protein